MPPDAADAKTRAVNLVQKIIDEQVANASVTDAATATTAQVASIVDAVEVDLAAADAAKDDTEERLLKVEVQARLLSDAVVAIADPGDAIAPAIKALKAEMP